MPHAPLPVYEAISSREAATLPTDALRERFLLPSRIRPGHLTMAYTHYDRMLVGGATPTASPLPLPTYASAVPASSQILGLSAV